MRGGYRQTRAPGGVAEVFETVNPLPNRPPSWNIAPIHDALVVRRHPDTGARHLDARCWGLVPRRARDLKATRQPINACAETAAASPMVRDAFARGLRCVVPADGFYEWRAEGGGAKQPYTVALRSGEPMALAGLWEGGDGLGREVLRSFTIVTCEANAKLRPLHDRMPIILPREARPLWLSENAVAAEPEDLLALQRPLDEAALAASSVPRRVGRVAEDDAGPIARDPTAHAPERLDHPPPAPPPRR